MSYDWIDLFLASTDGIPSPRHFRLWAAISAIAGAVERRVYCRTFAGPLCPNLYVTLSGEPGSGKTQAITAVRDLWALARDSSDINLRIHLAPDNVSNAAFYDSLSDAVKTMRNGTGFPIPYRALAVPCDELGVFLPKYDMGFLADLSKIYDNPKTFEARRRVSTSVNLDRPTVNLLAGATPGFLGELLPEVAWRQGFTSRFIFVHGHKERNGPISTLTPRTELDTTQLVPRLIELLELTGEMLWDSLAERELDSWFNNDMPPRPDHPLLRHYCERRFAHVVKLSMISALSRTGDLLVHLEDFERAADWLTKAETVMPDVFRAMTRKSDGQIIDEMRYYIYVLWSKQPREGREDVHERVLYEFLSDRVESHRIAGVIEAAEKMGKIRRGRLPDEWTPLGLGE